MVLEFECLDCGKVNRTFNLQPGEPTTCSHCQRQVTVPSYAVEVTEAALQLEKAKRDVPKSVRVFGAVNIVLICINIAFLIVQFVIASGNGVQDGSGLFRLIATLVVQAALIGQWVKMRDGYRKAVVTLTVVVVLLTILCITLIVLIGATPGAGAVRGQMWGALTEYAAFWVPPLVIAYRNWGKLHSLRKPRGAQATAWSARQ
jgi:hypothetical protein